MAANMGLPPGPLRLIWALNTNQDAGLNTIQQATGIQGLLAKLNEQKRLEMARGVMSGSPARPEVAEFDEHQSSLGDKIRHGHEIS